MVRSTVSPDWVLVVGVGYYLTSTGPLTVQEAASDLDEAVFNVSTHTLIGPTNVGFCPQHGASLTQVPPEVVSNLGLLQQCQPQPTPSTATSRTSATSTPSVSGSVPAALVGRWYQHDSVLLIKSDATFTWSSTLGVSSPTSTIDGKLHGTGPASASGIVTSSAAAQRVGQAITFTLDKVNDALTLTGPGATPSGTPSGTQLLPFCGPSAPSGYCGA